MKLRSWLMPLLIIVPLLWIGLHEEADGCIRFKKPGGSVPPGLRDPQDPPEGDEPSVPTTEPSSPDDTKPAPTTPTTPPVAPVTPPPAPTTGSVPGTRSKPKASGPDYTTWETWWELNRIDFFPRRWVQPVLTRGDGELIPAGPQALNEKVVAAKLWPMLMKGVKDKQVFVREASLITLGRVAANDSQREQARKVLIDNLDDRNHLVARAAALGLFYVADETSILPMYEVASNEKTDEDVRAFLALTMTNMGHEMAGGLLRDLADVKKGYYELVGAAIMGLGYTPVKDNPWIPSFLEKIAFGRKGVRSEYRALAVESFGRIGDLELGAKPLLRGLRDRDSNVRRSAAIALGVLDFRAKAECQIEAIKAPYTKYVNVPISSEDQVKIDALRQLIPDQRAELAKPTKNIVKALAKAMDKDSDAFVRRMAAVSLGRIRAQTPLGALGVRYLEKHLEKDRIGMREFCLLSLAIAGETVAVERGLEMLDRRVATSRGAAAVALGLISNPDREKPIAAELRNKVQARLLKQMVDDKHPYIRGFCSIALGMIGERKSTTPILSLIRKTGAPTSRAYGLLGLALLGTKQGSDDIVKIIRSRDMRNATVASHAVYALGLTKDRSALDSLVEKSLDRSDKFVQAAAIAAIGYVSSSEFYPQRHLMATGYNYLLGLDFIETYFYKL